MTRKVITDIELRSHWQQSRETELEIEPGTVLTPAAKDFIRENGIVVTERKQSAVMSRVPVPVENGHAVFVDAATGERRDSKGELMTHLNANVLVPKNDLRIAFRGQLDKLEAELLLLECSAAEQRMDKLRAEFGELLEFTRTILGCEVKNCPLPAVRLLGMNSAEIRETSHSVKEKIGIDHPIPDYTMGSFILRLNLLRTMVRETELSCVNAFMVNGACTREDLVEGLNRLSSCVYIIMLKKLAGKYD